MLALRFQSNTDLSLQVLRNYSLESMMLLRPPSFTLFSPATPASFPRTEREREGERLERWLTSVDASNARCKKMRGSTMKPMASLVPQLASTCPGERHLANVICRSCRRESDKKDKLQSIGNYS